LESDEKEISEQTIEKYKKLSIREFGGAFGDWGTLVPFIIGYIAIVGLNPMGIFICLGITSRMQAIT